jgi:hypothetical protein
VIKAINADLWQPDFSKIDLLSVGSGKNMFYVLFLDVETEQTL